MSEIRGTVRVLNAIKSPEEAYEACGAVIDALLSDGLMDDHLGDYAELAPVEIARREDGQVDTVVCVTRVAGAQDERVLVSV